MTGLPWWIWPTAALCALAVWAIYATISGTRRRRQPGRHEWKPAHDPGPGSWDGRTGSMIRDAELSYRARVGQLPPFVPAEDDDYQGGWVSGACWDPPGYGEEWDGEDDPDVPDVPAAGPVGQGPGLVDTALALAEDDPAGAGWTDQLLAELHHAPTVLDEPAAVEQDAWGLCACGSCGGCWRGGDGPDQLCSACRGGHQSRLADTGEIEMISQRAEYAAQLRDQDADAADFISRQASDLAAFRLSGLA